MHGRGGQGMKTASRILGSALFAEGFEVQDAPCYGAERRGAPIFATVRADQAPIHERGAIQRPDLVLVADETLVSVAVAGVLAGLDAHTVLLIRSQTPADTWRQRLELRGPVLTLPDAPQETAELRFIGAACAGAAARLLGVVSREALEGALRLELAGMGEEVVTRNVEACLGAYDAMAAHTGCVSEGSDPTPGATPRPDWFELPVEEARISAPDIHGAATSVEVRTGLWRTMRPVIDLEHCNRCHWVCGSFCPDGAIAAGADGAPAIDYDHCKGCLVCVAVCPPHAIRAIPEIQAREAEAAP
jgi:pyruvate ferredoxin oxidoreductase gamma subunit